MVYGYRYIYFTKTISTPLCRRVDQG